MYLTKDTYDLKTILSMLDTALSEMIENDCCYHCYNNEKQNPEICTDIDLCKSYLFEGLLRKYKKECRRNEPE